ncbi:MAG: Short-chain dehydrogenase/reductase [Burkholderiales bacterium]|jgi:pteridine reductase|nr:Short-chain dehydrogenase/reductase [Burkholderiales bacterium]
MSSLLQGKAVLITGGARRVGAAICRRLHDAGAQVMLHYRASVREARALETELTLKRTGSIALVQADLLKTAGLNGLVKDTVKAFGRLDALVNNASSFYPTPIGEITEEAWDDLMGTNLKAPLFLAQAAARELRKSHGCIVNILDIHAEVPMKSHLVYNAAKGGLLALTRSLARELGPEVRVNGIAPGTILWPENDIWQDEVARQRIINQTALKRIGEPDDIARAVEFLIAHAPYVTGQVIAVDGGRSVNL